MMKKMFLMWVLLGVLAVPEGKAQNYRGLYPDSVQVVVTPLPFACGKRTPYSDPTVIFDWRKGKQLPLFTYRDLNGKQRNTNEEHKAVIFRHFELPDAGCDLLAIAIEKSYYCRHILVTCKDGKLIDWIEGSIFSNLDIAVKQWRIDGKGEIQISSLKLAEGENVAFRDPFESINAQRIDSHYKVNADGKFYKIQDVEYKQQNYSREYLMDKTRNIWDD